MPFRGDRKFILNAEMLGEYSASNYGGGFMHLRGGTTTTSAADTQLSSGINNSNIISAINSAYDKASGNDPGGSQFAIQVNNGSGGFSGSEDSSAGRLFSAEQDNTSGVVSVSLLGSHNVAGSSRLTGSMSISLVADPSTAVISVAGAGSGAGELTLSNELQADGGIDVNSSKFTVASANGNTTIAGTADVAGDFSVATNKLTVASATGNTAVAGTLDVTGDTSVSTFDASGVTQLATGGGATSAGGTLSSGGDFDVATNKFTVASATGNTAVAGTLDVTGDTSVSTFDSSGITSLASGGGLTSVGGQLNASGVVNVTGLSNLDGGIAVDTDKFTVADGTGNTEVAGTLDVTGDTSVTSFDSSGVTQLATGGGATSTGGALTVAGLANLNGGIAVDTNAFTVADTSGNTVIAGTLDVTGDTGVGDLSASSGITAQHIDLTGGNIYLTGGDVDGNTSARFKMFVSGSILMVEEIS